MGSILIATSGAALLASFKSGPEPCSLCQQTGGIKCVICEGTGRAKAPSPKTADERAGAL